MLNDFLYDSLLGYNEYKISRLYLSLFSSIKVALFHFLRDDEVFEIPRVFLSPR